MKPRGVWTITACVLAIAVSAHLAGQTRSATVRPGREGTWTGRTQWGDPDLQGEWTGEGEYGVPFERPAQVGTRQFLTDDEYAKRLEDVCLRDERDLAPVDVQSGKVEGPSAPIPHWREYSRRTTADRRRASAWSSGSRARAGMIIDASCPVPQASGQI